VSRASAVYRTDRLDWIYLRRFPTPCCARNWQSSFARPGRSFRDASKWRPRDLGPATAWAAAVVRPARRGTSSGGSKTRAPRRVPSDRLITGRGPSRIDAVHACGKPASLACTLPAVRSAVAIRLRATELAAAAAAAAAALLGAVAGFSDDDGGDEKKSFIAVDAADAVAGLGLEPNTAYRHCGRTYGRRTDRPVKPPDVVAVVESKWWFGPDRMTGEAARAAAHCRSGHRGPSAHRHRYADGPPADSGNAAAVRRTSDRPTDHHPSATANGIILIPRRTTTHAQARNSSRRDQYVVGDDDDGASTKHRSRRISTPRTTL
jgi:hypothetical protein